MVCKGEKNGRAKLTAADVSRIRHVDYIAGVYGFGLRSVAKKYGVNQRTILKIVHRELWRHVS